MKTWQEVLHLGYWTPREGLAPLKETSIWTVFSVYPSSQAYQNAFLFQSPDFRLNHSKERQNLLIPREKTALRDCERGELDLPIQQSLSYSFTLRNPPTFLLPSFFSCLSVSI